jgi:putative inorganic carbon (HCO3(-)) transporter
MNVYIAGFKMLKDNFLIGIGTGNTTFRLVYGLYMVTGFDALGAYNIYLEMAIESGFFAPILFLLMVIYTFIKSVKTFLVTKFLENKIAILSCLMGIFAILIQGFFDTIWYRPQIQILFWLFLAILTVLITKKEKSNE